MGKTELASWVRHETASDGKFPVVDLWRLWSTPLQALLQGSLWLRIIVPVRDPSMAQIDLFKNYSHSIEPRAKKNHQMNNNTKNINIKVQGGARGYRRRKWTQRHEFKSWTRLIAFHMALILLGKVWIQLFSLQLVGQTRFFILG